MGQMAGPHGWGRTPASPLPQPGRRPVRQCHGGSEEVVYRVATQGMVIETPEEMFARVAGHVACAEKKVWYDVSNLSQQIF